MSSRSSSSRPKRPATTSASARARVAVIFSGVALIPLIYAGTLTSANIDPTHNLDGMHAAIVDQDTSATTADGDHLALGDDLEDELTGSTSASNLDWTAMDAADAAEALESGEVYAVLTVPDDFSRSVASLGAEDPADATRATLTIQTDDSVNLIAGNIAAGVGRQVEDTLRTRVGEDYLKEVYVGFTTLHDSLEDAAGGARQVADGAASATAGSQDLVIGLGDLSSGTARLASGASELAAGASAADAGAGRLSSGLAELSRASHTAYTGAQDLSAGASAVRAGADRAAAGAQAVAAGTSALRSATPGLRTGATELRTGLDDLVAAYPTLTDEQRLSALRDLQGGASALADATGDLDDSTARIDAGALSLVGDQGSGLTALASGASRLADGARQLAGDPSAGSGLAALDSGAAQLSSGASDLAQGTASLASGAGALAAGAADASSGGAQAVTGAQTLADGLGSLEQGSDALATGLTDGAEQAPSYTAAEGDELSGIAASPVSVTASRVDEVPGYGYGLAPYFMSLALWVGALAFYLMSSPLRRRLIETGRPAWMIALRSYLPGAGIGAVQALLMVLVVRFGVGIEAVDTWGLVGIAVLTSLTFVAINQALIALLGAPGRFVALLLIVVQLAAAGGTYPIETAPSFFQAIHGALPLTYAVEAFRSLIAGGSVGVAPAVLVELLWLVAALALTVLAAARARRSGGGSGGGGGEIARSEDPIAEEIEEESDARV